MYKTITDPETIAIVDLKQEEMLKNFYSVPPEGRDIEYEGYLFHVFRNTFFPFKDSSILARTWKINPGEKVLDMGTGSGVLAILAALQGGIVTAVEHNPDAIKSAKYNIDSYDLNERVRLIQSNLFENVPIQKFDVIIANLPFRNKKAANIVESSMWDSDLKTHKVMFERIDDYLACRGRIYMAQSNFGEPDVLMEIAAEHGFDAKLLGKNIVGNGDPRVFYAFEFTKKIDNGSHFS